MKTRFQLAAVTFAGAWSLMLGAAAVASASTYGISGITGGVSTALGTYVPAVLAVVGGLIALVVGVKLVRKFIHP